MPIYEYRCEACGHEFEKLQKISDPVITECPSCGQAQVKKLISAAGFRLKGGGWYETDFKKSGKRNLAAEDNKGASKSADGSKSEATQSKASDGGTSGSSSSGSEKVA